MSRYRVKELFYSLQGEGFHSGRPAVFCRFSGCNLWNGLESDRASAACRFCDTDFVGTDGTFGGSYDAESLAQQMYLLWSTTDKQAPFCVLTGGEPALQFDESLRTALQALGFEIAIETNGTLPLKAQPDWVCVSPKGAERLQITQGDELKLVYPQNMHPAPPEAFASLDFTYRYLQPLSNNDRDYLTEAIEYCLANPNWRLSIQLHKIAGIR